MKPKIIAVFGAASEDISDDIKSSSYKVGASLAKNGCFLIFGAGSTGVMGQVARGYLDNNPIAKPFGSTTEFIELAEKPLDDDSIHKVTTRTMHSRKEIYELADTILVMPGGHGTLSELEDFIVYKQLAAMAKDNNIEPVTWDGNILIWIQDDWTLALKHLWSSLYKNKMAQDHNRFVKFVGLSELEWYLQDINSELYK